MKHNIEVDNIILDNEELLIENKNIKRINANGKCTLNLFNCNIIDLEINIYDNASLIVNYFNSIDKLNSRIVVKANNKSAFILNHSFINKGNYNLNIFTDFLLEDASITVNINGINDGGKVNADVNGYVHVDKFNNVLDENMKIVNLNNGVVMSNPNMYISASKVIANHNTTVGGVRLDELFYLMSKGIDKEEATNLIIKGFLIKIIKNNKMQNKILDLIK